MYSVVRMSAAQRSGSVTRMPTSAPFQIPFHQRGPRAPGQRSRCHAAWPPGPVVPYASVCLCQSQDPVRPSQAPPPNPSPLETKEVVGFCN